MWCYVVALALQTWNLCYNLGFLCSRGIQSSLDLHPTGRIPKIRTIEGEVRMKLPKEDTFLLIYRESRKERGAGAYFKRY